MKIPIGQWLLLLLISIVVLEIYFKIAGVGNQEFLQPDIKMGCRHIPGKLVTWRMEGYSNDHINSFGLRDSERDVTKPAGVYRIALLGDSAVESLQVPLIDTFGKVLESKLNSQNKHSEVINFGCSLYSTGQELLLYEQEVKKYKPDAVVLLYGMNDPLENVVNQKQRKQAVPRPYFYLDESGQLKQDDSILANNIDKLKPNIVKDFLRENSAIYGVLTQADLSLSLNEPKYNKLKNWISALFRLPDKINTLINKQNQTKYKEQMANVCPEQANTYPDQNNMAVTKSLIARLADEAKANRQKFILAIFPNVIHELVALEQAKQLKALAQQKQFMYLDLSQSFLADADPSTNFLRYHFSKKGHQVVANDLFQIFSKN